MWNVGLHAVVCFGFLLFNVIYLVSYFIDVITLVFGL